MRKKVVLLGDFILDNAALVPRGDLSVEAHLRALLPKVEIKNLSRRGFTTDKVLNGATILRPGSSAPETYKVLEDDQLKTANYVVLSLGLNNIKEFLQNCENARSRLGSLGATPDEKENNYIREFFPKLRAQLKQEYHEIIVEIRRQNSSARIIPLVPYYPLTDREAYTFYRQMGSILKTFNLEHNLDSKVLIEDLFEESYASVIRDSRTGRYGDLVVADINASIDPGDLRNFQNQLVPSHIGGLEIAKVLVQAIRLSETCGVVYKNLSTGAHELRSCRKWFPKAHNSFPHCVASEPQSRAVAEAPALVVSSSLISSRGRYNYSRLPDPGAAELLPRTVMTSLVKTGSADPVVPSRSSELPAHDSHRYSLAAAAALSSGVVDPECYTLPPFVASEPLPRAGAQTSALVVSSSLISSRGGNYTRLPDPATTATQARTETVSPAAVALIQPNLLAAHASRRFSLFKFCSIGCLNDRAYKEVQNQEILLERYLRDRPDCYSAAAREILETVRATKETITADASDNVLLHQVLRFTREYMQNPQDDNCFNNYAEIVERLKEQTSISRTIVDALIVAASLVLIFGAMLVAILSFASGMPLAYGLGSFVLVGSFVSTGFFISAMKDGVQSRQKMQGTAIVANDFFELIKPVSVETEETALLAATNAAKAWGYGSLN